MATSWTTIPTSQIDTDSPVTQPLVTSLRDNPVAIAEGSLDAPKIALKSDAGSFTSGNLDFNGLGAWSGVWFTCMVEDNTGGLSVQLDATDDGGATYLGAVNLITFPIAAVGAVTCFFDFATGVVRGTYMHSSAGVVSQTIAGSSLNIDGIRFTGALGITAGVMIHPNGGESAT